MRTNSSQSSSLRKSWAKEKSSGVKIGHMDESRGEYLMRMSFRESVPLMSISVAFIAIAVRGSIIF